VWQVADLDPGQEGVITLTGTLTEPLAAGVFLVNSAGITATDDITAANNRASATLLVLNAAPLAVDDSLMLRRDDNGDLSILATQPVTIPVLLNDSDPNSGNNIGLTVSAVGVGSQGGTVTINSNSLWVDYTPATAFTGTEIFTYTAQDSGGLTGTATVTVTVVNGDGGGSTLPGDSGGQVITVPNTGDGGLITITITLPGGSADKLTVVYIEQSTPRGDAPQGYVLAGLLFDLEAYLNHQLQPGYVFSTPITLTLTYSDTYADGLVKGEESLELRRWDGGHWRSSGITLTQRITASNQLTVVVDRAGSFALLDHDIRFTYLPLVTKGFAVAPDLVITNLVADGGGITVTVKNLGNTPVVDAFWVDVYFDPSPAPPPLNRTWQSIATYGANWGVTQTLAPGEVLTLTVGGPYYTAGSASFPAGAQVYGYVDSINYATTTGNVRESNEDNNVVGPVLSTAGSGTVPFSGQDSGEVSASLPAR
jgi:hypothetical protein